MVYRWMFDHRIRFALWAVITLAALVLVSCGNDGMYQGSSDDQPRWR